MKKEWHCRYESMHPGGSHIVTLPIFVRANTREEAEAEVRKIHPDAIKIYVIREYLETWQMPVGTNY